MTESTYPQKPAAPGVQNDSKTRPSSAASSGTVRAPHFPLQQKTAQRETDVSPAASRGRLGKVTGVRVAGIGSYVPDQVVTNEDLASLGCDSEWIQRRTGILRRRRAASGQSTSDLGYQAAIRCLERSGVSAEEIDLVVVATVTPDYPMPSTACLLQERLGIRSPAFDVSAACAGFTYGMLTAAQFVGAGNSQCALVVGADVMSDTLDPNDKMTYPLFGDGAGAMLLRADKSAEGILSYELGSEGGGAQLLYIPAGGSRTTLDPAVHQTGAQYMKMDGRNVFKWAVRVIDESAKEVLRDAGVKASELDLVVLHQANQRIIDSAVSGLDIPPEKVFVNLEQYGNTSAASIPLAIDEAIQAGKLQAGDLVLLCGFGAGLAWGTALMRW
jgi:3-oxoacyl-[acyl-carrier-protein] synthase-3